MRRRFAIAAVTVATALALVGCGGHTDPAAAPTQTAVPTSTITSVTTTPTTTTPIKTGVGTGIIVASCGRDAGSQLTVASYDPQAPTSQAVAAQHSQTFAVWTEANAAAYTAPGACPSIGTGDNAKINAAGKLRSAFNSDYTALLAGPKDPTSQPAKAGQIGLIDKTGVFKPLSRAASSDFVTQNDAFAMYFPATHRVYYYDMTKTPPQLMSMTVSGDGVQPETQLGQQFPYQKPNPGDWGVPYMPNANVPIIDVTSANHAYNHAGTLEAELGSDANGNYLAVNPPGQITANPKKLSLKQAQATVGWLVMGGFVDDHTVAFHDGKQIYAVNTDTGAVTQLLQNDRLLVWDVTPSADGQTVAFLASEPNAQATSPVLYSLKVSAGASQPPLKLATFTGAADIVDFAM